MKTVYDVHIEEIDGAIERTQTVVNNGSPKDYAHYREHIGELRALRQMREHLVQLIQRQEQDDDE